MNNWGAGPKLKLKQTRTLFLYLCLEGQVVLSQVTDFHPSMYEGVRRQRGCMESSFFFFFFSSLSPSFFFFFIFPYFSRLRRAGCDFCFPPLQRARPVLAGLLFALQNLWHPQRLRRCRCRAHLLTGAAGDSLLQVIPEPYASLAEITQAFWLRCRLFLCPPWFKLVTSITYPRICKVHFVF